MESNESARLTDLRNGEWNCFLLIEILLIFALLCHLNFADKDVVRFLLSRHGLKADLDFVKENLMPGLAGALGDSPAAVFDIVEIVSILLIPYLKKASASVDDDDNIFSKVLTMILKDSTASTDTPILDRAAMQNILETYGEFDVPPVVIDEMLLAAGALQEPTRLSAALLMRACTDDIAKYNNDWDETATTHFDDVFQGTTLDVEVIAGSSKNQNTDGSKELDDEEVNKSKSKFDEGQQVKRVYTAASVDGIAENYSSKAFVAIVWFLVVMLYFSYVINLNSFLGALDCSKFNNDFACKVVNSIVAWLLIFVQLRYAVIVCPWLASRMRLTKELLQYSRILICVHDKCRKFHLRDSKYW